MRSTSYILRGVATNGAHVQKRFLSFKNPLAPPPGPPKLPKEDQEEFERLQRDANVQLAFQDLEPETAEKNESTEPIVSSADTFSRHPEYRTVRPEFEGDKNPVTGEIGGPKQDPLRHGDYSFNGRVTDF